MDGWGWSRRSACIDLRAGDRWHVLLRGGASNLDADLRALDLRSFEITGGVSGLVLALPAPKGIVPLRIRGGAVNVCILRPAHTAIRARISGGVSSLRLDRMELGAVGGATSWESDGASDATNRYELEVNGGACNLLVDDPLEGQGGDHPSFATAARASASPRAVRHRAGRSRLRGEPLLTPPAGLPRLDARA